MLICGLLIALLLVLGALAVNKQSHIEQWDIQFKYVYSVVVYLSPSDVCY